MTRVLRLTKNIKNPNLYAQALEGACRNWAFNEERALKFKGFWREKGFNKPSSCQLHLEIGSGTGLHFSRLCSRQPEALFLAMEWKYKPLIQTVKRFRKQGCENARGLRYNGAFLENLFAEEELNNVYIHFPDPWPKSGQKKHRLINETFAKKLYKLQRKNSFLEFKTDWAEYSRLALSAFKKAGYRVKKISENLYGEVDQPSFEDLTQFELIFVKKQTPINFLLLEK